MSSFMSQEQIRVNYHSVDFVPTQIRLFFFFHASSLEDTSLLINLLLASHGGWPMGQTQLPTDFRWRTEIDARLPGQIYSRR